MSRARPMRPRAPPCPAVGGPPTVTAPHAVFRRRGGKSLPVPENGAQRASIQSVGPRDRPCHRDRARRRPSALARTRRPPPRRRSRSSSSSDRSGRARRTTSTTPRSYAAQARSYGATVDRDLQPQRDVVAGQGSRPGRERPHLPRPRQRLPQPVRRLQQVHEGRPRAQRDGRRRQLATPSITASTTSTATSSLRRTRS